MSDVRVCHECQVPAGVYDSRPLANGVVRRRRRCPSCDARWNTIEITEALFDRLVSDTYSNWQANIEKTAALAEEIKGVIGVR